MIIQQPWYKNHVAVQYPKINKFVQNYITYRYDFNKVESFYLSLFSIKRHHAKIIRQKIYELSHDDYGNRLELDSYASRISVFEVYRPMPINGRFSGLEFIHCYQLSTGHHLEICFNRADIAKMANVLDLCTATRMDLIEDQRLGKMLRINIKKNKKIIANICVHAEDLIRHPCVQNKGFYILGKDHEFWTEKNHSEMFLEIKNHLNEHLKIYDFDIAIP